MIDFHSQSEEIEQIKSDINKKIEELGNIDSQNNWDEAVSFLQNKFSEIQTSFSSFNDNMMDFDEQDREDAKKFYSKMNSEIQSLETRFNELKKEGFHPKKTSLAEQFKDEPQKEMPRELRDIHPEDQQDYPSNRLVVDEDPRITPDYVPDITSPLNPLEAGIETQEEETNGFNCTTRRKILIAAGSVFLIAAVICLIVFLLD